jgi:uncharacterized protein (TIGR02117 family)
VKTAVNRIFIILLCMQITLSCTAADKTQKDDDSGTLSGQYTVYIINNHLHTGIIIPVITESAQLINALEYFRNYDYADFGWGEEDVYQNPVENYCLDVKAVMLINSSVVRVEGYNGTVNSLVTWSDFAVKLTLSHEQFQQLCSFINNSFKKDSKNGLIITSQEQLSRIIFFKSVYKYNLFNTCNTWVAKALKNSGFNISGFFIITSGQLYNSIKVHGTVLKSLH